MRLATVENDFWQLKSAEELHRKHPKKCRIPSLQQRQSLRRGQAAKLIFDIETEDEDGKKVITCEKMWVIVTGRCGDTYIGILGNQPACIQPANDVYLRPGAEIPFKTEHIIDIEEPPRKYVERELSRKPSRIWPRDDEDHGA